MKTYTQMAVGLTPESGEMHAVAVEWNQGERHARISILEHETGQLILSSAGDIPNWMEPLDGPDDTELSCVVYMAATRIRRNGLRHRDRALSFVVLAAGSDVIQWFGPAEISRSLRSSLDEGLAVLL